jgi:hypothetical protein
MIVQVRQTAATTQARVAQEDYQRYHQEVLLYTVVQYKEAALAENTKRKRAK